METVEILANIYKIKCNTTNKTYIGQTKSHKLTRGKYYKYGIHSRFNEHVISSRKRDTPLCKAIKEYGRDDFTIKLLETCSLEDASSREQFYIEKYNSLVPNGYNVQKYSRSYKSDVKVCPTKIESSCRISGIRKAGVLHSVRIYVYKDGETQRINFCKKDETFEENLERAKAYAYQLTDNVTIDTNINEHQTFEQKYCDKIKECSQLNIIKIKVRAYDTLIKLSIYDEDSCIEHTFGSRKATIEENKKIAFKFISCICDDESKIKVMSRSITGSCLQVENET